jgi:hypothetical protein
MGSFLITDAAGNNNYLGDVSAAFACIAVIGDLGCGFEHQFRSVEAALQRSSIPGDTNEGFLRDDAVLGVIMLTDEDDCSVPPDSTLLDPRQSGVSDPLGGLQTGYRCNEFGHLCDGRRPPHTVTGDTPLENCRSAEEVGRLVPVSAFVEKLKSFKADPTNQIFAAALAGPPTPYIVELRLGVMTTDGRVEPQPAIGYSCGPHINPMGSQSIAGAPSVRIRDWVEAFGDHGVFESIGGPDFGGVLRRIAEALGRMLAATCIDRAFTRNADGTPSCGVTLRRLSPSGAMVEEAIPACDSALSSVPCWQIAPTASCAQELRVCWYPRCSAGPAPADVLTGQITCALPPP